MRKVSRPELWPSREVEFSGDRRALLISSAAVGLLAGFGLSAESAFAGEGQRGGTLTATLTPEPPTLVIGVGSQAPTLFAGSKIYQGLLRYSPTLEPMSELARSWEVSPDKTVFTFRLEDNVKFHDGTPMTSEDVIFSITSFHKTLSPRVRAVFAKIKNAEALDPLTVRFTLDAPFEPFLMMFDVTTASIVPKHIYEGTEFMANPANQTPIGTGPFVFSEWQRGNFIRLKRFEGYWREGLPYLDEIVYRIVPDSQSRALAVESGEVQMCHGSDIEPFDVPRLREVPTLEVTTNGYEYFGPVLFLDLNNRIEPLNDKRVRRALAMALDRSFVVDKLWFGVGKASTGPWSSVTRFYNPKAVMPAFDVAAANALLDEAGLARDANGIRFSIGHLPLPYGAMWNRLSEYIRTALREVGVDLVIENVDAAGWGSRIANWDYDSTVNVVYQYADPSLGVERTYVSSNIQKVMFANTAGYSNSEVDELFAKARGATDSAERERAFHRIQEILVDEVPLVWLSEISFPTVYSKRLRSLFETGTGAQAGLDSAYFA